MNIVIAASWVPFVRGGGELHVEGLQRALQVAGHQVELLRLPLRYDHDADVYRAMQTASALRWQDNQLQAIDRVISLQFPAWGLSHPDHWAWVMHQHRRAYELAPAQPSSDQRAQAAAIHAFDTQALTRVRARFANSARVAERLLHHCGLSSAVLHHPPPHAESLHCLPALPYVFFPSRLEDLKRQWLAIEAAAHLRSQVKIVIAGTGGQAQALQARIDQLGVGHRVRLIGRITTAQLHAYYAQALAVLYPPVDEDYGYVTLEAMLSAKPVVTCHDSGGPLAFVEHDHTGWVETASAETIAARLDWLMANSARAADAGRAGLAAIRAHHLSWQTVVDTLTAPEPLAAAASM